MNALFSYPTTLVSKQKCAYFYSKWSIMGYETCTFWDLWIRSILCIRHQWNIVITDTGIHIALYHLSVPLPTVLVLVRIFPYNTSQTGPFRVLRSGKGVHSWPFSIVYDVKTSLQLHKRLLGHGIPQFLPKPAVISSQVCIGSEVDTHFLVQLLRWNIFTKNEDQVVRPFLWNLRDIEIQLKIWW